MLQVLGVTSDVLFPVEQQRELANVLIQSGRWRGGEGGGINLVGS